MEYKEILGILKSVGQVKGEGEKTRVDIVVGETTITCFTKGKVFDIPIGSEVIMKCGKKDYNGKAQLSVGRDYIKIVKRAQPENVGGKIIGEAIALVPKKEEKVDWDGKERRMVRMNSLSHATELVRDAQSFTESKDLNKMVEEVKDVAGKLEEWIYRV